MVILLATGFFYGILHCSAALFTAPMYITAFSYASLYKIGWTFGLDLFSCLCCIGWIGAGPACTNFNVHFLGWMSRRSPVGWMRASIATRFGGLLHFIFFTLSFCLAYIVAKGWFRWRRVWALHKVPGGKGPGCEMNSIIMMLVCLLDNDERANGGKRRCGEVAVEGRGESRRSEGIEEFMMVP
jgi:hypothetical protein